ncbi:MAG: phosphoribosylformylglycinamidine synthase subunit PurL [Candidatus Methylomirabilales bacterium]
MGKGAPRVTEDLAAELGLSLDEYRRLQEILGHTPNFTELGIFAVMWSEHCSYKSSRVHLKTLPTEGPRILQGPGENAGVVDVGDGLAVIFKIESHNHPSSIEPYQGAATGVGGIVRDILTMGARPIALFDSLRFGPLHQARNRYLFSGVVGGIAGYGNAVGVPTVGGELATSDSYSGNPLVNVLCVGLASRDRVFYARAGGVGNPVVYVGAKTGRDGIHGATMASETFEEGAEERRPTVQVGDPFREKLLIEACLEVMATDAVVGIQDMGAAGLTCSTAEMASRGGTGIEINLAAVPRRETGMTSYEIMLSESQERMLLVVKRGREALVQRIFKKWGLDAVVIGRVTGDGLLRVRDGRRLVAEIPAKELVDGAPVYHRPMVQPAWQSAVKRLDLSTVSRPKEYEKVLLALLASPAIASKAMVWEQYDHMLFLNTVVAPGADAAVLRLKGTGRGIAVSVDGNGRYTYLDPYRGGMIAVVEAARNVVCAGAEPVALTNCLNFGDPTRPEIMWQFAEAVRGIAEACRALNVPVTGGNVSLYNETMGRAIIPTPVIGVLGVLEDIRHATQPGFMGAGPAIVLVGETTEELGGSEYLAVWHGLERGQPPGIDLERERRVQHVCLTAIRRGLIRSAHDCSDGGLAVALAECCISDPERMWGAEVRLGGTGRPDALLFGEAQSRIVLSVAEEDLPALLDLAAASGVPARTIGRVGGSALRLTGEGWGLAVPVATLSATWREGLSRFLRRPGGAQGRES